MEVRKLWEITLQGVYFIINSLRNAEKYTIFNIHNYIFYEMHKKSAIYFYPFDTQNAGECTI